jgi:hypothetical protein
VLKSRPRLRAILTLLPTALLAGCVHTAVANDVPPCEDLIPQFLLAPTPPPDQPASAKLPDGHDDARPWQGGFIGAMGALEIESGKKAAVNEIYATCLRNARKQLHHDRKGFVGRIFGQAAPAPRTDADRLARSLFDAPPG